MAKTLDDWLDTYHEASSKVSEIVRNLALGAIAIIWLFKNDEKTGSLLPKELTLPLLLVAVALFFDFLQYLIKGLGSYLLHYKVNQNISQSNSASQPPIYDVNNISYPGGWEWAAIICFLVKIGLTMVTYILLALFLLVKLNTSGGSQNKKKEISIKVSGIDSLKNSVKTTNDKINININVVVNPHHEQLQVKPKTYPKRKKREYDCNKNITLKKDKVDSIKAN